MNLCCGLVGLPNVGKSTLFNALVGSNVGAENFPFCTTNPNRGQVSLPDERVKKLSAIFSPQKTLSPFVSFVDIAGLVKGASQGEGLGNRFLSHIREATVIIHVVRCFEKEDIVHVNGRVDPLTDIQTIEEELIIADIEQIERQCDRLKKKRGEKGAASKLAFLSDVQKFLETNKAIRKLERSEEEDGILQQLQCLSDKPVIYLCNHSENLSFKERESIESVRKVHGSHILSLCGKLESDIVTLPTPEERKIFMKEWQMSESGLNRLINQAYVQLGLATFYTAGEKEVRGWSFERGSTVKQAAGIIHSDFEKNFIRAEVYSCEDLFRAESEKKLKSQGKIRIEGRDYLLQDGDVIHVRANA